MGLLGGFLNLFSTKRGRLLHLTPSFDAAFFLFREVFHATGREYGVHRRAYLSSRYGLSLFMAEGWGRRVEILLRFYVDHNCKKRYAHLTSCVHHP